MPEKARCRVENCKRLARIDGLCVGHQWDKHFDESDGSGVVHAGLPQMLTCEIEDCDNLRGTSGLCTMHYLRQQRESANQDHPKPQRRRAAGLLCEIEGCEKACACKGLCTMHYARMMRGAPDWADPNPHKSGRRPQPRRACSVDGCIRRAEGRGLCKTHLMRRNRNESNWDDPIPRPRPPRPEKPVRPGPVPADVAADLAADYLIAKRVNGSTPHDSPDREVNRRFNARIADLVAAGHTHAQVAHAAGASKHMVDRRITKMRSAARANARPSPDEEQLAETCSNGHPRTPNNLTLCSDGKIRCKVCRREAQARRMARLRDHPEQIPEITEDMHGGATAYRYGCRCPDCRRFHSEQSGEYKWMLRFGPEGPMGPEVRGRILDALRRTGSVAKAAAEAGVKHQAVYGAVRAVPGFGTLVDELTRSRSS